MVDLTEDMSEDLSELRSLLLAPEQTQLDRLQERLDDPVRRTHEVSRLLPGALTLKKDDPSLTATLTPHVEQAFFTSLRRSPQAIVDAIAPIMGPAIRQAIRQALQSLTQSLNQTVEHSFSLKGSDGELRPGPPVDPSPKWCCYIPCATASSKRS